MDDIDDELNYDEELILDTDLAFSDLEGELTLSSCSDLEENEKENKEELLSRESEQDIKAFKSSKENSHENMTVKTELIQSSKCLGLHEFESVKSRKSDFKYQKSNKRRSLIRRSIQNPNQRKVGRKSERQVRLWSNSQNGYSSAQAFSPWFNSKSIPPLLSIKPKQLTNPVFEPKPIPSLLYATPVVPSPLLPNQNFQIQQSDQYLRFQNCLQFLMKHQNSAFNQSIVNSGITPSFFNNSLMFPGNTPNGLGYLQMRNFGFNRAGPTYPDRNLQQSCGGGNAFSGDKDNVTLLRKCRVVDLMSNSRASKSRDTAARQNPQKDPFGEEKKEARLRRFAEKEVVPFGAKRKSALDDGESGKLYCIDEEYKKGMEEQRRRREEIMRLKQKGLESNQKVNLVRKKTSNLDFETTKTPKRKIIPERSNCCCTSGTMRMDNSKEAEGTESKIKKVRENRLINKTGVGKNDWIRSESNKWKPISLITNIKLSKTIESDQTVAESGCFFARSCCGPGAISQKYEVPLREIKRTVVNDLCTSSVNPVLSQKMVLDGCYNATKGSYLNGSIVKIRNLPPGITVKDISLMCTPVGKPIEIKLNSPRDNSAGIRFPDPSIAENFYNLFDKREINDYVLDVILI